jgi:YVTN family beta-propeller protein
MVVATPGVATADTGGAPSSSSPSSDSSVAAHPPESARSTEASLSGPRHAPTKQTPVRPIPSQISVTASGNAGFGKIESKTGRIQLTATLADVRESTAGDATWTSALPTPSRKPTDLAPNAAAPSSPTESDFTLRGPVAPHSAAVELPRVAAAEAVTQALATTSTADPGYPLTISGLVTWRSIVADTMSWLGIHGTPAWAPNNPVPDIIAGLWTAARRFHYTYFNSAPTVNPGSNSEDQDTAVITGNLGVADADGDKITISVIEQPDDGKVVVASNGDYTFTPDAELAKNGGLVSFTIRVDDTSGNPPHLHGLRSGFLPSAGSTTTIDLLVAPLTYATASAAIPVGFAPDLVAVSPSGSLYVASREGKTISRVNTATGAVSQPIPVPVAPDRMTFSDDGSKAYIGNALPVNSAKAVAVLDVTSARVEKIEPSGNSWQTVRTWSAQGKQLQLQINNATGAARVRDKATGQTIRNMPASTNTPNSVAFADKDLYKADQANNAVLAIKPTAAGKYYDSNATKISVGQNPTALAVAPNAKSVFVVNAGDSTMSVIDTLSGRVTRTISVGNNPTSVAVNPVVATDGSITVYVANKADKTVSVISVSSNSAAGV